MFLSASAAERNWKYNLNV